MTINRLALLLAVFATVGLSACQNAKEVLGQGKRSPDEFAVYSRTPLSVPPNYRLRPPGTANVAPGEQPDTPSGEARSALLGRAGGTAANATQPATQSGSTGTIALLRHTGGLTADPNIRNVINRESTILAEADESFTERLLFWRKPTEYGQVIDPKAESKRIRDNQAQGKPVTEGVTPTIQRRPRALLEGIFN